MRIDRAYFEEIFNFWSQKPPISVRINYHTTHI